MKIFQALPSEEAKSIPYLRPPDLTSNSRYASHSYRAGPNNLTTGINNDIHMIECSFVRTRININTCICII